MNRVIAILKFVSVFYLGLSLTVEPSASQEENYEDAQSVLKLTIASGQDEYELQDAITGNIFIIATLKNISNETVIVAHPNVSFPHQLIEGQSFTPDPTQSHLAMTIKGAKNTAVVILNNGLRMFEPGNRHQLSIAPGHTEKFILGWFGPKYSLGQWTIDQPLFKNQGLYDFTLRFKNTYPVAYSNDQAVGQSKIAVWTGELQSNTISMRLK